MTYPKNGTIRERLESDIECENFVLGDGVDIARADDSSNTIAAGAGNDWIHANGGDDVLLGGEVPTDCSVGTATTPLRDRRNLVIDLAPVAAR